MTEETVPAEGEVLGEEEVEEIPLEEYLADLERVVLTIAARLEIVIAAIGPQIQEFIETQQMIEELPEAEAEKPKLHVIGNIEDDPALD